MKAHRVFRRALLPSLTALLVLAALIGFAIAAAPSRTVAGRRPLTLQTLAAKLTHALAPAQVRIAARKPVTSVRLTDFRERGTAIIGQGAQPRAASSDPATLVPFDPSHIIQITNAQGQVVRAPQSATDTSIAPNQPLTFTVRVNSDMAATQATAVYIQIKDPDSLYQDVNLSGPPREHKVFTRDPGDIAEGALTFSPNGSAANTYSDDLSSTTALYNGAFSYFPNFPNVVNRNGNQASQPFTVNNVKTDYGVRGAIGGYDGAIGYLTYGHGTTPGNYIGWGQEYECQYLNAHSNGANTPASPAGYAAGADAVDSDYGNPYYLAGYDDQIAGSAASFPARSEWLKLTPVQGDPELWTGTWRSPISPSDFYTDVIVYDNQNNYRIFDNVWGFSTLPFQSNNDILFVADNTLGQKFAASALASKGLVNLRPVFYGAESYYTGIDVNRLPNAVDYYKVVPPATLPSELVVPLFTGTELNGLGFGSYNDQIIGRENVTQDGVSIPRSQAYSLWRILSRGAVPQSVYQAYEPTFVAQPAVADPQTGFTAVAADGKAAPLVPVATRCILWASPFTADLPFDVGGTILDASTQTALRKYVAAGGRLYLSGQDVATALTLNGVPAFNQPGSFLYDVLNVSFTNNGNGGDNETLTGPTGIGNPISYDTYFNLQPPPVFDDTFSQYYQYAPGIVANYTPPSAVGPLTLGNNYIGVLGETTKWRTDGALTQLGPIVSSVGRSQIQSQISLVTPQNGAAVNFSVGGNGVAGTGLVYHSNSAAAAAPSAIGSGFGSRVVFASFGLEGLGMEYYHFVIPQNQDVFCSHNNRPNILHNIVNWLRTGSYEGRIFLGSSTNQGVPGATVYLLPFRNVTIPSQPANRQTYSTLTSDGSGKHPDGTPDVYPNGTPHPTGYYHIDGLEPGSYIAVAYKTGYTRSSSPTFNFSANPYTAAGDTTVEGVVNSGVNLNIVPLPPGSINGKVTLNTATGPPVVGATVTFTTSDTPPIVVTATTAADGTYSATAPVGTYTGVASSTNPAGNSPPQNGIVVQTNTPTTANFIIAVNPGTITGKVTYKGVGFPNANVSFTASGATSPAGSTTTLADGSYKSPGLPAGPYTIAASATGKVATNTATATVALGVATAASNDIVLTDAVQVTLSGNVSSNATPAQALPGATVTVKDTGGNTIGTQITDGSGNYSFGALFQGTYVITAVTKGYLPQSVQLTITASTTQNFSLTPMTPLTTLVGGHYNLVSYPNDYSPPASPSPFDDVFGPLRTAANPTGNRGPAAIYSSTLGNYIFEPTFPADGLHAGRGYFVFLTNPTPVFSLLGTPPAGSTVSVPLQGGGSLDGWNMIGVPSATPISVSRLQFLFPGNATPVNFHDAVYSYNAVYPNLESYNPATNTYSTVGLSGKLQPFQGYWLRVKNPGMTVLIPTGGG